MLRAMATTLWIGTRKGAFTLRPDTRGRSWTLCGPRFLGHIVHHIIQDPREPRVLLMAAKAGHPGPTVFRSTDRGRAWREASQPPAFRKAGDGEEARPVERVFWLTPGHAPVLIDVRERREFEARHLEGARDIPLGEPERRLAELTGERPAIFVCRSGGRSLAACAIALRAGVDCAAHLEGGLLAWAAEVDPGFEVAPA